MSKFSRARYVLWTVVRFSGYAISGRSDHAEQWLHARFHRLGGLYIKFLQLLVLRDAKLSNKPKGLTDALSVFDQVTTEPINIQQLLYAELGSKSINLKLDSLQPIAAGSFAQVYSAQLEGERVIVKVLRPSVLKYLPFDLSLLGFVARSLSFFQSKSMVVDISSAYESFKAVTLKEIDYIHEVAQATKVAKRLHNHPVIHIPYTYAEWSSKHVIVQERVSGLPLTSLLNGNTPNKTQYVLQNLSTDLNYVLEELAVELIQGSLHGGTHGDPHPGNIYILPNNKIALIDFGISAIITEHQSELVQLLAQYAALYRGEFNAEHFSQAMVKYFVPELTYSIQTLSTYMGREDLLKQTLAQLGASAAHTLQERAGEQTLVSMLEEYRMLNVFVEVVNKNNRFGLSVNIQTPAFMRSAHILINIVRKLDCDMQLLGRAYGRVVELNSDLHVAQTPDYDRESIDRSLHTVACWFEKINYSDPSLYNMIMKKWELAT